VKARSVKLTGVAAVAIIGFAGLILGSCGVEGEQTFRPVKPSDIPFSLAVGTSAPSTTTSSSTTIPVPITTIPRSTTTSTTIPTIPISLYFVRGDGKLLSITRQRPKPSDVTQLLKELTGGPISSDSPSGLRTVVKPEHVRSVKKLPSGVAEVVVTPAFSDLGSQQQLAIAQLVYTFTEEGGVGQVSFSDTAGTALPVPTLKGDGVLKSPVSREDYPAAVAT
jgi:spore germination protein GerM